MYYKRTFTATLDLSSYGSRTILSADTSGATSAVSQPLALIDFIGSSIATAMRACGFDDALYDSANQLLYPDSNDDAAILIYGSTSLTNYYFTYTYKRKADGNRTRGVNLISNTSSTYKLTSTTTPGAAVDVRMPVTIAGNPKGSFIIHLGCYASDIYYYLTFGYGVNEITGDKVLAISSGNSTSSTLSQSLSSKYIRNLDGTVPEEMSASEDGGYNVDASGSIVSFSTSYGSGVVLRPFFSSAFNGMFSWDYKYLKPANFTAGTFYEINNLVYMCFNNCLVCVTDEVISA